MTALSPAPATFDFNAESRDPWRQSCPGCGSEKPLVKSPLSREELAAQGLFGMMCPNCARHVWLPKEGLQ